MKLSDTIISHLLDWVRGTPNDIVVQNFFVGAWEMDVFKLTPSGYIYEYEVKTSRADFKNDFKKSFDKWVVEEGRVKKDDQGEYVKENKNKHDQLQQTTRCNKFFFVVPENLIKLEEVPEHCGLIYINETGSIWMVKDAPLLHRGKAPDEIYKGLARSLSFREANHRKNNWFLKWKNEELHTKVKNLEKQLSEHDIK